jgi:hypothetical protein
MNYKNSPPGEDPPSEEKCKNQNPKFRMLSKNF